MAAADYYETPSSMRTEEERLEIQARDIDQKTLLFQARLRGFLIGHRVFRHHKDDVATEDNEHSAPINRSSYRDTHSITGDIVDERRTGNANNDIYVHDLDLQARYQEPIKSAANDSEHDNDYSKANKTTDDILKVQTGSHFSRIDETAITEFPATSDEATLEAVAKS